MHVKVQSILLGGWLALLVFIHSVDTTCLGCPQGWTYYNKSCYFVITNSRLNWTKGFEQCKGLGAQLLVLNSEQERHFIRNLTKNTFRFWLGCKVIDGEWVCSDDKQQPLATHSSNTCLELESAIDKVDRVSCGAIRQRVCEKQIPPSAVHCQATQDANLTKPGCLLGHAYKATNSKNPIQCCEACHKDPNCRSFNLEGKICHLNNVSISQVDADKFVTTVDNCIHYTLD